MIFFIHSFWIAYLSPDSFRHCSNLSLRLVGRLLEGVYLLMIIEIMKGTPEKRAESPDEVLLEITPAFCTFGQCSFKPSFSDSFPDEPSPSIVQVESVGIKRLYDDLGVNTTKGEYDMWRLRIEQYFQVQDYALWDVMENGNLFKPDAQTLFAAIQTRFGGNEATKKTQKTLLKKMYENFSALSTESLDSIFNRLQKIVSQLAILGENISQEDLKLKFLRSLPSEWNTHAMIWRNKSNLDTRSFDDLYNDFKIVKQESQFVYEDLKQIYEDELKEMDLKWQLALLSMRTRRFFQKTGRKITINGSDTAGYDKNRNQDSSRRTVNVEETSSKAMVAIDGAGFDWSYMADDEVPTNMALMAFSDSKESPDAPLVEELVSNDKLKKKTVFPTVAKMEFVIPKQQEKPVRKPVKYAEMYREHVLSLLDFKDFDEEYVTFGEEAKGRKNYWYKELLKTCLFTDTRMFCSGQPPYFKIAD
ncbi:hypothetical protein Tco_0180254 [Tanacetum coccineum]